MPNLFKNVKASVKGHLDKRGLRSPRDSPNTSQLSIGSSEGTSSITEAFKMMGSVATTPSMTTVESIELAEPIDLVEVDETPKAVEVVKAPKTVKTVEVVPPPPLYAGLTPGERLAKQQAVASVIFNNQDILDTILFYTRGPVVLNWECVHSERYWNRLDDWPLLGANSSELTTRWVYINKAFAHACTRMEYHTLELMTLESLHRVLRFLRHPDHMHLRQYIKVLNIYAINFTYFGEWVRQGEIRELSKIMPAAEVPELFPNVHTVNLLDYARIDSTFLGALPKLRILRTNQNALPHPKEDAEWERIPLQLKELSILHAKSWKGVWPGRHRMEGPTKRGPLYSDKYLDMKTGWLRTPGVLTSITRLTFNAPRLWGLLDMARIIKCCPVLTDLQCEIHSFFELWDHIYQLEHPLPWVKLESTSVTSFHIHLHDRGGEDWSLMLPELLAHAQLPQLRRLQLSFMDRIDIDVPTRHVNTYISTRGKQFAAVPERVTASVHSLELNIAKPSSYSIKQSEAPVDAGGLLPATRVALQKVTEFLHFDARPQCVHLTLREENEYNTLPTDLQADDRATVL